MRFRCVTQTAFLLYEYDKKIFSRFLVAHSRFRELLGANVLERVVR